MSKISTPSLAKYFKSGQTLFIQGGAATPRQLIDTVLDQISPEIETEFTHLHLEGAASYVEKIKSRPNLRCSQLFVGNELRKSFDFDRFDYLPCFLSEIPQLFRSKRKLIHIALIQVSPPDAHGYCSLGTSVDITRAAIDVAPIIFAQINPKMPRTHGDSMIHISQITEKLELDTPLVIHEAHTPSPIETAIAKNVAGLIENGATLQVGIGAIPDAVLSQLKNHKNLGLHTEVWSDGALELIRTGVINNSLKSIVPGKSVSAFAVGSQALYDFIDDNPACVFLDAGFVNNPSIIARNPKVCAINSAVEVDLSGQVCADSIGSKIISGVGGQMDFMRGASLSPGGKPIIALSSRAKNCAPRLVPQLKPGAGVVTTRAHVHYVVTEFGVADLYGKNLAQRAKALIQIAHPEDRESLEKQWKNLAASG